MWGWKKGVVNNLEGTVLGRGHRGDARELDMAQPIQMSFSIHIQYIINSKDICGNEHVLYYTNPLLFFGTPA